VAMQEVVRTNVGLCMQRDYNYNVRIRVVLE